MMLIGRIEKQEGPFWSAECPSIGAYTQGRSRADAADMLREVVELMVGQADFKATVTELGPDDGGFAVYVSASEPAKLAALVLRYQREIHKLSLADVAEKLGASSRNAYASYEQGKREPSLGKYLELLAVVAPDLVLAVTPRAATKARVAAKRRARRA